MDLAGLFDCWYKCKRCAKRNVRIFKHPPKNVECEHCSNVARFMSAALISDIIKESEKKAAVMLSCEYVCNRCKKTLIRDYFHPPDRIVCISCASFAYFISAGISDNNNQRDL